MVGDTGLDDTEEAPEPILLAFHPELLVLVAKYRGAKENELRVQQSPVLIAARAGMEAWVATTPTLPRLPDWPGFDSSQKERDASFRELNQAIDQQDRIVSEQHDLLGLGLTAMKAQQDAHFDVLDIASEIADMLAEALAGE